MRALALRTTVAAMLTTGLLLGGAGVAAATGSSASTTTTSTTSSPTTTTSAPTTTTSTSTKSYSTSTTSTTSTTSSPTTTTSSPTTTSATTTTSSSSTHPSGPKGTATASRGCAHEISVAIAGTGLAEGLLVEVQVLLPGGTQSVPAEVVDGVVTVVVPNAIIDGASSFAVGVLAAGQAFGPFTVQVPTATDICTAEATISLARDCTTPDSVLASVAVTGLTPGTYGVGVVGEAPDGTEVLLSSQDVVVTGTGFSGTLPLTSLTGTVPLGGFRGIALVIDGRTLASVGGSPVEVTACVAPAPLPVAPAQPVVTTSPAASTTPAVVHPAKPAALAQTGAQPAGLLLLAGLFLGLGGLTTFVARRTAR